MKLNFKCMPQGSLPYKDVESALRMQIKLFENIPYLPFLPLAAKNETLVHRIFSGVSAIHKKDKNYILESNADVFKEKAKELNEDFNNSSDLSKYITNSFFFDKYLQIIEKIKPKETVVSLLGPFTISQMLKNDDVELFSDKLYRKFLIQLVCVKSLAYANLIKSISPETKVIVMLEEPELKMFGSVKRENDDINLDVAIGLFTKIVDKLHANDVIAGIQSFGKCDWQIAIDSGFDIISFDAYNNPNNLNIIASKVNAFLAAGGYINWGFVPVTNEDVIKNLKADDLYNKLIKTFENLINEGVTAKLVYNNSTISTLGNMEKLPIMFAEKALMLSNQVAKKIPTLQ